MTGTRNGGSCGAKHLRLIGIFAVLLAATATLGFWSQSSVLSDVRQSQRKLVEKVRANELTITSLSVLLRERLRSLDENVRDIKEQLKGQPQ